MGYLKIKSVAFCIQQVTSYQSLLHLYYFAYLLLSSHSFSDRHLKLLLRIQQQRNRPVVTQIHLHVALKTAGFHC